ncbi:hypothetical protein FPANT_9299 [Fusarium pseudoanthophilum]|uniref:Uncharacterized protein n=1 Tax=Fusarium pseudoanthophilum TaxID=48495 RepID=A0A8H5KV74_9HYPO|nr:hypothetical protein FPANT_9299 [Fusarium pseudoanthophilum]
MIIPSNPNSVTGKSTALRRSVRRTRGGTHTAVPSNDLEVRLAVDTVLLWARIGWPRTVPSKGGYASTHSTETIGHSQARASLDKTRIEIIAASTGNQTKEAQVWAWLRDADRPWEGFGWLALVQSSSLFEVPEAQDITPRLIPANNAIGHATARYRHLGCKGSKHG